MSSRKSVLELSHDEARSFFLKHESYCNVDLPKYFSFSELLSKISQEFTGKDLLNDFCQSKGAMGKLDDVNYLIYANKDGKLSWRPFQIIHPLVYVALVHGITKEDNWEKLKNRFKKFQCNEKIKCLSIPVKSENRQSDKAQQISNWWEQVEQQSISLALEYDYIFDTDVADCYGSVYTHAIAWAAESKKIAKIKRNDHALLGNFIDRNIQNAQNQQTNGIPQGSVLMDFIAEMILGYIDRILSFNLKSKKIVDYQILRYRDDYRVFVKNHDDGLKILQILSEIMMPFGFKLNASKTKGSQDVITQSVKADKLAWLKIHVSDDMNMQKELLLIRQHGIEFPNSGSLLTALNEFDKKIEKAVSDKDAIIKRVLILGEKNIEYSKQMIGICADIGHSNPKAIPICCSIISKLLQREDFDFSKKVFDKLSSSPNSGYAQIWLQRMLKVHLTEFKFNEKICALPYNQTVELWDNSWLSSSTVKQIFADNPIFIQTEFDKLGVVMMNEEVDIFHY